MKQEKQQLLETNSLIIGFDDIKEQFLDICEAMTGKREKLTFIQISALLEEITKINPNHAVIVAFRIFGIYADAQREFGGKWWYHI